MISGRSVSAVAFFSVAGAFLSACGDLEPAVAEVPNVILIITDDQGYGDIGVHGNPFVATPNIDALAHDSVRFEDFHVSPSCSPTRASLLTGRDANRTGVWHTTQGRGLLREDEVTIAEHFRQAGYATGLFGKWHLGGGYPFAPRFRGFDEVLSLGGGGTGSVTDFWNNTNFDPVLRLNGKAIPTNGFITDTLFDHAMRYIAASRDAGKPFFVLLSTNAPHGTYNAPQAFAEPYAEHPVSLAHFYGMITNIDANLGRLRAHLEETGIDDETILIFMTDNGTAIGHEAYSAGMRGHKGSEYDGGHRVPFFIRWPGGGIEGPRSVDTLAAHIDVAPTLLDLAGIEAVGHPPFDGVSLRPLFADEPAAWPSRSIVIDSQRVLEPVKWKQSSVMRDRWRLVNRNELYDIEVDPAQEQDIADEFPEVVAALRSDYERWWQDIEPTFDATPRFVVGSEFEDVSILTTRECLSSILPAWGQAHVRAGEVREGDDCRWPTTVTNGGEYRFELRRWPQEVDRPIRAGLPPGEPVPGTPTHRSPEGRAVPVVSAMLTVAGRTLRNEVGPSDRSAVFSVVLNDGEHDVEARFETDTGERISSYYVYVAPRTGADP